MSDSIDVNIAIEKQPTGAHAILLSAIKAATSKANMPIARMFILAIMAGIFIGLGGMFFCTFLGDATMPFGCQRLIGGLCFCLGLSLVLCCGAELFTGNSLMVCGLANKKITLLSMLKNWIVVWIGNLFGSLVIVCIVYFSKVADMNSGLVASAMINVAVGKVALDPVTMFAKGILCNLLVCLAVWIGFSAKTVTEKIVGLIFPITAFVACGAEHCVANMFFLPMGYLLQNVHLAQTPAIAVGSSITLGSMALNIFIVTLGNIVGGAILVGLAYFLAYRKNLD